MSASQRHRFASRLARGLAAAGFTGAAACTAVEAPSPDPDPPDPTSAEQRIARDLERLDALEVVELGAIAATRTEHQWIPYGGYWSPNEVELTAEEQADRLDSLADVAEQTAGDVDPGDIAEQFWDDTGAPSLCTRMDDDHFCLDIQMNADNLARINALEIVEVVDILRTAPEMTGFCYSSWDTVHEDDCTRALELDALVEATRGFPSANAPDGEPD